MPTRHAAALLGACAAVFAAGPPRTDAGGLQGGWTVVTFERAGVKPPKRTSRTVLPSLTFRGDRFTHREDGTVVQAGTWKIDASKTPAAIDLAVTEGRGKGKAQAGIYRLELAEPRGGFKPGLDRPGRLTLTLCFAPPGKPRPAEFASTAANGHALLTLWPGAAGIDPNDPSIVYDTPHWMLSGAIAHNGKAYDVTALSVDPRVVLHVPDTATVERHDVADVVLVYMEKRSDIHAHFPKSVSIADYRKRMGCAVKLEKGDLLLGTFGEVGFLEGSSKMKLTVVAPRKLGVAKRPGLSGGYGGRSGERLPNAINPERKDPKPALTDSRDGKPPRWLPPRKEDGWHEVPAVADVGRRGGKAEEGE